MMDAVVKSGRLAKSNNVSCQSRADLAITLVKTKNTA